MLVVGAGEHVARRRQPLGEQPLPAGRVAGELARLLRGELRVGLGRGLGLGLRLGLGLERGHGLGFGRRGLFRWCNGSCGCNDGLCRRRRHGRNPLRGRADRHPRRRRGGDVEREPRFARHGELRIRDRRAHVAIGNGVGVLGIGGEQRLVGEDVDAPRESARSARHHAHRARREDLGAAIAGRAHAERQVLRHLGHHERPHAERVRDAVAQLAQRRLGERLVELGLAEQHDLQELVAVRFQVRQQPHLLERVLGHDVRLVDQDHHAAPGAVERDQVLLQLAQRHAAPLGRELELEVVGDRVQDLVARERGRGEVDGRDVLRQPLHQHAAQHGLAAADLARHLDDALVVQHRVDQRLQRRAAVGALEEEIGVRRDAERRFREPEVLEIEGHRYFSSLPIRL